VKNDWWCDVGVGDFVVLNDGAERLEVEGGHDDRSEARKCGEVNQTLEAYLS
jgi:hypothetical protein